MAHAQRKGKQQGCIQERGHVQRRAWDVERQEAGQKEEEQRQEALGSGAVGSVSNDAGTIQESGPKAR